MSTEVQEKKKAKKQIVPKYKVILHNDEVNSCEYVIECLLKTVNTISPQQAIKIMLTAHYTGKSVVTIAPLEMAEFYKECLTGFGLTSSIEPE